MEELQMFELITVKELMEYCKIGRNSALKLAKLAKARVKIGGRLLIDKNKIDEWIIANRC